MPKASGSTPSRPALRRNQACLTCRKRKLKCNAARPHCATCVKQWEALVSVPAPIGYAHPTEPQCSYDPVEGLSLAPDTDPLEKIKDLEDQIAGLKGQLSSKQTMSKPHSQPQPSPSFSVTQGSLDVPKFSLSPPSDPLLTFLTPSPETRFQSASLSPELPHTNALAIEIETDPFLDLLFSGWNTDLPDPATLNHYVEIFFRCDPCGPRLLHKPSFLQSLLLSPRDPGFPHPAILHAICASASRYSGQNLIILPDGTRSDKFAQFHANKTRQYIDKTMSSGEEIFSVMQACVLLSWYFYQEGRWVEVWVFAAFQTRVAIPLRLNYPGTFSSGVLSSPGAYLAPPRDLCDLESRRRAWWMTIIFDRLVSVGGWVHSVDERDIATELPLRAEDFESDAPIPSNSQDLSTTDLFTQHPPQYTDSFLLLLKAVMMFGKVTDFNVRGNLRAVSPPSKNQDPFFLPGFEELDDLVYERFLRSLPPIYKNNSGLGDTTEWTTLDTDLYMVHVIPHAATITLHNPYMDFSNQQSVSTERCVKASRRILAAYYSLSATSVDIARLHPFVVICWYLAAVVQVQLCKYFIEINDTERESTVWGEINILRFAMMQYGQRSPIGIRQERLLQGLMREIVRMTGQKHPLEVGVPLYPFSHQSLFRTEEPPMAEDESTGVPLPTISDSPDQASIIDTLMLL